MQLRWYSDGSIRWTRSLLISYLENHDLVLLYMLDELLATNRAKNSVLVLAYLPTRVESGGDLGSPWGKVLAEYARQRGILYFDLADDFHRLSPQQLDQFFIAKGAIDFPGGVGHYTEAGNAFIADLIYRRLRANPETAAKLHARPVSPTSALRLPMLLMAQVLATCLYQELDSRCTD